MNTTALARYITRGILSPIGGKPRGRIMLEDENGLPDAWIGHLALERLVQERIEKWLVRDKKSQDKRTAVKTLVQLAREGKL